MTTIIPEISTKSKYWISKHRYYELKHFCMQYGEWVKEVTTLEAFITPRAGQSEVKHDSDPCNIENIYIRIAELHGFIKMVDTAATEADDFLGKYILKAIRNGYSYDYLKTALEIPCSRDMYYDRYRKFFYILHTLRG